MLPQAELSVCAVVSALSVCASRLTPLPHGPILSFHPAPAPGEGGAGGAGGSPDCTTAGQGATPPPPVLHSACTNNQLPSAVSPAVARHARCLNDAPCPPLTSHGASIMPAREAPPDQEKRQCCACGYEAHPAASGGWRRQAGLVRAGVEHRHAAVRQVPHPVPRVQRVARVLDKARRRRRRRRPLPLYSCLGAGVLAPAVAAVDLGTACAVRCITEDGGSHQRR
jgi:hypothetical protein